MKNLKLIILVTLLAFSLPSLYGGCVVIYSSGDWDSNKDQIEDETSGGFIGITSQAAISPMNAESLASGALTGGLTGAVPNSLKSSQSSDIAKIDVFRPLRFPLALGDSLRRIELGAALNIFRHSNVITESNNLEGSCGGELSYTLTLNKVSGKFSGNFIFTDYCDDHIVLSGETDVDGTFDVSSGVFNTATFSFDHLSDDSHALDGEISVDFIDILISASFTVYSEDKQSGKVYWLKNYSINLFEFFGRVEIELFGTFYHPNNGFVKFTTPESFVVFDDDDWPASGNLAIQGDGGTQARLIAIDQLHYRIETDTDGDGIFDWDSEVLYWSNL